VQGAGTRSLPQKEEEGRIGERGEGGCATVNPSRSQKRVAREKEDGSLEGKSSPFPLVGEAVTSRSREKTLRGKTPRWGSRNLDEKEETATNKIIHD